MTHSTLGGLCVQDCLWCSLELTLMRSWVYKWGGQKRWSLKENCYFPWIPVSRRVGLSETVTWYGADGFSTLFQKMTSLRSSSPIWASLARSRETRFARPNRRACSPARKWHNCQSFSSLFKDLSVGPAVKNERGPTDRQTHILS